MLLNIHNNLQSEDQYIVLHKSERISNVKTPRIAKILTYIIEITSYDGPTVSRKFILAILTFIIVVRNCQTLPHIRLELKKKSFIHTLKIFKCITRFIQELSIFFWGGLHTVIYYLYILEWGWGRGVGLNFMY